MLHRLDNGNNAAAAAARRAERRRMAAPQSSRSDQGESTRGVLEAHQGPGGPPRSTKEPQPKAPAIDQAKRGKHATKGECLYTKGNLPQIRGRMRKRIWHEALVARSLLSFAKSITPALSAQSLSEGKSFVLALRSKLLFFFIFFANNHVHRHRQPTPRQERRPRDRRGRASTLEGHLGPRR